MANALRASEMGANNSFKPKPLRYSKSVAEKACHAFASTTRFGLTQALAPMEGISHITFIVRDLERMSVLLCQGLGAREVYDSAGRNHSLSREKFYVLGGVWLAAMEGEPPAERSYQHVAFAVKASDLLTYQSNLQSLGIEIRQPRNRVDGEGQSLYFYDFDNHLFELHTGTLEQRLAAYGVGR